MEQLETHFKSLGDEPKQQLALLDQDVGNCFLSCSTIYEALLNKDCLCITFSVTRTELAIVRPESLKIKVISLYLGVLGENSFVYSF